MDSIPQIVLQNPYRILGVYANSRQQEILANKSKANAFLNVNRPVEYPLDLNELLPPLTRTLDMMNEAEAHLAIAKEQIKYAQFWFLKMTSLDDNAFNHLIAGNLVGAMEIWSEQENLSSLQNKLVCFLIKNMHAYAVKTAEKLYEQFGNDYISKVDANCTFKMAATELLHQFVDSLGEEIGMQTMLGFDLRVYTKAYISSQTIGPLINKISSEVDRAKQVDYKDSKGRIEAASILSTNTKEAFQQLSNLLPKTDTQYQMIADKLGLEILQCGIDYFLGLKDKDDDAPYTAMKMLKHARTIVVGSLAIGRCDDQIRELQKYIDNLPPKVIAKEHDNLQEIITLFVLLPVDIDGVLEFLKDTCEDLISIKDKLGKNHSFYIQEATLVAQKALNKSIEVLNEAQKNEFPKLDGIGRSAAIKTMSHIFATSWKIMLWIELIDSDIDFQTNRLKPNKIALKEILDQVDAFKTSSLEGFMLGINSVFAGCAKNIEVDKYTYYTELEMYNLCSSISSCKRYLRKYPQGQNAQRVRKKLLSLQDDNAFNSAKSYNDYVKYIHQFPNGAYLSDAKRIMTTIEKEEYEKCYTITAYIEFVKKYPKSSLSEKAQLKIEELEYNNCKTYKDYQNFMQKYFYSLYSSKAKDKINSIESEIKQNLTSISTVEGCCSLYRKYNADPGGKIDEKAYSLCETHDDLTTYTKTFTTRRDDAQKRIERIERKRMFIVGAIAAAILLLIIILANSN